MGTETNSLDNEIHWDVIPIEEVPEGQQVLPAVWAFRRKRRITTGEVYKWKARLNIHGGKQLLGINYWETYAPVVGWSTIRLFLNLMIVNGWTSRQIDFILAFPQADIECDMYIEIPIGFKVEGISRKTHVLRLKRNLYGQRQAGRVWNTFLHDGLIARGFGQSAVDMCVY
jgi:Reverse transcriptase (RNA-dependent DNA polymerase)